MTADPINRPPKEDQTSAGDPSTRGVGDVERDTGAAGAEGERERIDGTTEPGADASLNQGGAGFGPKAGAS